MRPCLDESLLRLRGDLIAETCNGGIRALRVHSADSKVLLLTYGVGFG